MIKHLISVIVPCYNVEKFLPDCLASIESQTYKNFEVIFVNDGSKDSTLSVLEKFCENKPNFRVLDKENGGVSTARNLGLAQAEGEFVYFFDPDDYMDPRTLEIAYNQLKNNPDADLCVFKNQWIRDSKNAHFSKMKKVSERKVRRIKPKTIEGGDELMSLYFARRLGLATWNKLYRLDLIQKIEAYPKIFPENVVVGEDNVFEYWYFLQCKKAVVFSTRLYAYRMRKGSAVRSRFKESQYEFFDAFTTVEQIDQTKFPTSLRYIKSLKCANSFDFLFRASISGNCETWKVENVYEFFKDGARAVRKAPKNFWYIKILPLTRPLMWFCKKRAIRRNTKATKNS